MISRMKDIDSGTLKTEEAEELYAREAKIVEASDFHPEGAGAVPVASTDIIVQGHWFNQTMRRKNAIINGKDYSRLSFIQT